MTQPADVVVSIDNSPLAAGHRPLLRRMRLVNRIGHPSTMTSLTVMRAPTGYGKTTLLRQWLQSFSGSVRVIGVGIDINEQIAGAKSQADPLRAAGQRLEAILTGGVPVPAHLPSDLSELQGGANSPLVILIDNLDRYRPEAIAWLVEQVTADKSPLAASLRLVLSGRTRIDLPIGTAAAQGIVTTIGPADLAFSQPELEQLIGESGFGGAPDLDHLLLDTSGWPAGVRMHQGVSSAAPGTGFAPIVDSYVESEILDRLEPALQNVLLGSAILPYLTGELIAATCPPEIDPAEVLSGFGQMVPVLWHRLPNGQPGYRILPIVRTSLQRISQHWSEPAPITDVVQRAANWLIEHEQLADAVQLAHASGEWTVVLRGLIEPCRQLAIRDRHAELLDVIQSIPADTLLPYPDLTFWRLLALLSTGRQRDASRDWQVMMEERPLRQGDLGNGRQLLLHALRQQATGDVTESLDLAKRALGTLPPIAHHERFRALSILRDAQPSDDTLGRAIEDDLRFERSLLPLEQRWWWSHCVPAQIDRRALSGNLEAAYDICLHQVRAMPDYPSTDRLALLERLAEIELERGDPEAAHAHVSGMHEGLVRWRNGIVSDLVRARVLHDLGQDAVARDLVYTCIRQADSMGDDGLARRARTTLAQFWLDRDKTELALAWAEEYPADPTGWITAFGEPHPALVHAELLVATRQADRALTSLNSVALEGRRRGHHAPLVRCYALMALAQWSVGNAEGTQDAIAQAVQLGSRNRFRRSYLVGSIDVRSLTSRPMPVGNQSSSNLETAPVNVMTDREMEILQLVASGLRNPDISERLYISPFTVKNHLANIFAKLDAKNRTDAVRIAQSMGWL